MKIKSPILFCFFSIGVFFHDHSRITGLQGKGEGISVIPHYHFHPLHRHLDITQAITAEISPQFILKVFHRSISRCGYCQKPPIFHLPTALQFQNIRKNFFVVPTKVPFNLNLLSSFSEGPNSNQTKVEIQKFFILQKRNLSQQIFRYESQTTCISN